MTKKSKQIIKLILCICSTLMIIPVLINFYKLCIADENTVISYFIQVIIFSSIGLSLSLIESKIE